MRRHGLGWLLTVAVLVGCGEATPGTPPKDVAEAIQVDAETAPIADGGDALDDPAIWVNATALERSLIIGTNKVRGLVVYDLDGRQVASRDDGGMNNVDLRQNVTLGDFRGDLVAATNSATKSISLYAFDGAAAAFTPVLSIPTGFTTPEGLCMYRSTKTGDLYIFAGDSADGTYGQWRITALGAGIEAEQVRTLKVGSPAEGCAADDEAGMLFIAEEDVALWRYGAEPESGSERVPVDTVANGHLTADAEGIALIKYAGGTGHIIVSSQGSNSFNVYDRQAPHAFRAAFTLAQTGGQNGIDGVEDTDGIEATTVTLRTGFEEGLLVVQDGFNYEGPDGSKRVNQNFKLVAWDGLYIRLRLPDPPAPN
jgi:3-phytase